MGRGLQKPQTDKESAVDVPALVRIVSVASSQCCWLTKTGNGEVV